MNNVRQIGLWLAALLMLLILLTSRMADHDATAASSPAQTDSSSGYYLPMISRSWSCPLSSSNSYTSGIAYQYDLDDPIRPAWNHADKNLNLRGYALVSDSSLQRHLVDYGSDDPNQPPQFAALFQPARVPQLIAFYHVNSWQWAPSPDPGQRASPITQPQVTALGLKVDPGENIHVPFSGYDIGGGMEVTIIFADENSVTLRYSREDSAGSPGYTVFVDKICTDPKLLYLYQSNDLPNGPRYHYVLPDNRPYSYNLPNLPAGSVLGITIEQEIVVAISDSGRFWDPRSCNEWWQIRPGYSQGCPKPN